jgi:hypothetical protein
MFDRLFSLTFNEGNSSSALPTSSLVGALVHEELFEVQAAVLEKYFDLGAYGNSFLEPSKFHPFFSLSEGDCD